MVKYKRLTKKREKGVFSSFDSSYKLLCKDCRSGSKLRCSLRNCQEILAERLGELEDKIENGELREVPRGAVILTPEELTEEMKAAREKLVGFERQIKLLNNELHRELVEHKAFIEKTAIEVGRLKAEKAQVVKEFAERVKAHAERCYDWDVAKIVSAEVGIVLNVLLKESEK